MTNSKIFNNYIKDYTLIKLVISIFCMIIIAAATALNAWMMQPVLDEIFINKNKTLIVIIPLAIILVAILKGTASYFQSILMVDTLNNVGVKLYSSINNSLFDAIEFDLGNDQNRVEILYAAP